MKNVLLQFILEVLEGEKLSSLPDDDESNCNEFSTAGGSISGVVLPLGQKPNKVEKGKRKKENGKVRKSNKS